MRFDSSIELFESARRLMPGGVSSPVRAISPNPFYTTKAEGPYLWDADGNRIIDYCLAYGPMILGPSPSDNSAGGNRSAPERMALRNAF